MLIQALQSKLRGAATAIIVLLILPLTSAAEAHSADEQTLSAALTLRIAKFIDWPSRPALAEDIPYFIVGVYGSIPTQSAFAPINGKSSKGKTVKIVRVDPSTDPRDLRRCHIIYVEDASGPTGHFQNHLLVTGSVDINNMTPPQVTWVS